MWISSSFLLVNQCIDFLWEMWHYRDKKINVLRNSNRFLSPIGDDLIRNSLSKPAGLMSIKRDSNNVPFSSKIPSTRLKREKL